jgi:hypothetical protein
MATTFDCQRSTSLRLPEPAKIVEISIIVTREMDMRFRHEGDAKLIREAMGTVNPNPEKELNLKDDIPLIASNGTWLHVWNSKIGGGDILDVRVSMNCEN